MLPLLLDVARTTWREPDEGIWEVRGPRRHFVHSKVLCWVAFDRAIAMVEQLDDVIDGPVDTWRAIRDEIHDAGVRTRLQRRSSARSCSRTTTTELDASVLMIPLVGFLPGDDPRVVSTIEAIDRRRELTVDGFVHALRSRTHEEVDGIGEPEGVFLACSFWMVDALAAIGRRDEAAALFERLLDVANDVGLYSEEYDPRDAAACSATSRRRSRTSRWSTPRRRSSPTPSAMRQRRRDRPARIRPRAIGRRRASRSLPPWLS